MATKKKQSGGDPAIKLVAQNRRARHDYEIRSTHEAGLVLLGSEVKSLRAGQADLKDSYVFIRRGEAFIHGLHIAPYGFARDGGHEPERERKLLLNRLEIDRLGEQIAEKGMTLVPLRLYFRHGKAKLEFGVGKGRRTVDKRHALKERDQKREMQRAMRR